jgi:predicted nucleic acid-binding protein
VRALDDVVVSELARVEVPAALWRKRRAGAIRGDDAAVLVSAFERDWLGDAFAVVPVLSPILERAARLCATHPLRAYDGVQLASALAAQAADPALEGLLCFDEMLASAARVEGLAAYP